MTRDTVMGETPTWRATSWIVTILPPRRPTLRAKPYTPLCSVISESIGCNRFLGNLWGQSDHFRNLFHRILQMKAFWQPKKQAQKTLEIWRIV
jgi:hypothetical protein